MGGFFVGYRAVYKPSPLGGRWHGEAVTDEGHMQRLNCACSKKWILSPHQSKIK